MTGTTEFNLRVEAGTTFSVEFFVQLNQTTPFDLTGWEARSHVRRSYAQQGDPTLEFNSDPVEGIVIDPLIGKITLTMLPEQTKPLVGAAAREYVYDLEIFTVGGTVFRPFKGTLTLYPEVTRE